MRRTFIMKGPVLFYRHIKTVAFILLYQSRLFQLGRKIVIDGFKEILSIEVMFAKFYLIAMNAYCKVLCHFTAFYRFNTYRFQGIAKIN